MSRKNPPDLSNAIRTLSIAIIGPLVVAGCRQRISKTFPADNFAGIAATMSHRRYSAMTLRSAEVTGAVWGTLT